MNTISKPLPYDRWIAAGLQINASAGARAWLHFAEACDACLMADLMRMSPRQRIEHADWFSTGPVDTTVRSC